MAKWFGIAAYIVCGLLIIVFVLPFFGWKALSVLTPSMKPGISPGDLVIIHRVPLASIQRGNIVTYANLHEPGTTITHRVISVKTIKGVPSYITKGDANPTPDAPVAAGQIVGRLALVIPGAGRVAGVLHNPIGLLALVVIPALYVIWTEVRNIKELLRKPRSKVSRRLDGVYRVGAIALAVGIILALGGGTLAELNSTAALTGNQFAIGNPVSSPTPTTSPTTTPSPKPSPCNASISNTGPESTDFISCTESSSVTSESNTSISVDNRSSQTAISGGITIRNNNTSGTETPGSVTNNNVQTTTIQVTSH